MSSAPVVPFKWTATTKEFILRYLILFLVYVYAFSIRLYSVLRYESVIHEFDPYFNYRSTIKLVNEGFQEFWNWFDTDSWYPLGRVVGGTVYPGIMLTAGAMYRLLAMVSATVPLRDVCVLTGPFFSGLTAFVAYLFGTELKDRGTGLIAATLMATVPGYIQRSTAGSYDNEAVAIFALILTFYLFVRAVRLGTVTSAALAAFGYLYMAASWGAYVFISNLIPLYVLVMIACRRYHRRVYLAYTTFWAIGGPLAMQVPFIGANHVKSSELLAFNAVWLGLQGWELLLAIRRQLTAAQFERLVMTAVAAVGAAVGGAVVVLTATGRITPWTGRFWTLMDPTYAKKYIPIIASVSEHQPTTWSTYYFDLNFLVFAAPAGLYYCFKYLGDQHIFLLVFALTSIYFSGIMIRLMLVAAPAFVLLASLTISSTLDSLCQDFIEANEADTAGEVETGQQQQQGGSRRQTAGGGARKVKGGGRGKGPSGGPLPHQKMFSSIMLVAVGFFLVRYATHCNWVSDEAYSSPSIVLISGWGANRHVMDDFREAYYWLRHNTAADAKIMSWWDYGYQITAMANRTIIVDNNTWNNTHIATVGRAMASDEDKAYEVMQDLDVDYALVIFGGAMGYSSDDINKFLWMVRIGGGVFPDVKEESFLNKGEYTVSSTATQTMLDSLMYRMSYYDFGKIMTMRDKPMGFDLVRQMEIGLKDYELKHLDEAFTSQNWLVRIYKVRKPANRGQKDRPQKVAAQTSGWSSSAF